MFRSKIKTTATQLGVPSCSRDPAQSALEQMRKQAPTLVIFDLNSARTDPLATVAAMRADAALAAIPTVGFVSHVQTELIDAARSAGVGEVLARSAFTARLPDILTADRARNSAAGMQLIDVFCMRAGGSRRTCAGRRSSNLPWLSELASARVHLKLESLQLRTRSKRAAHSTRSPRGSNVTDRGAGTARHGVGRQSRTRTGSGGEDFQLPLVVFTPRDAPRTKLAAIRRHGATLRAEGRRLRRCGAESEGVRGGEGRRLRLACTTTQTSSPAQRQSRSKYSRIVHRPALVVPIGGGGLISGVAAAAKPSAARAKSIGVEVEASCAFLHERAGGAPRRNHARTDACRWPRRQSRPGDDHVRVSFSGSSIGSSP